MITPKSPIPVHPHFNAKNTSLDPISDVPTPSETPEPEKVVLSKAGAKKGSTKTTADKVHINAEDVAEVELVNDVPEGTTVLDGVVLDGSDEAVAAVLDQVETAEVPTETVDNN